jgi:hypothetical protein
MFFLRLIFFLLVLVNLVFFAWGRGYFGRQDDGREPQRLKDQLQPDKLRIVPPGTAPTPATPSATPPAAPSATPPAAPAAPGTPPAPQAAAPQATVAVPPICRVVRGLSPADAEKLRAGLTAVGGLAVAVSPDVEPAGYWVLIPPLANRAAADKKAGELKKLGVSDFYVIGDAGPRQFAISLGLFKAEKAANDFLAALSHKGVKSARVEAQPKAGDHAQVQVKGPADAVTKGLGGVPAAAIGECAPS